MAEFVEVLQKKEEMCNYYQNCNNCPLCLVGLDCEEGIFQHPQEAEEIIMTWTHPVDWSMVDVDTPILVKKSEGGVWEKRYFAKYAGDKVFAWGNGRTSWSAEDKNEIFSWQYAKLAEEGEQNEQR